MGYSIERKTYQYHVGMAERLGKLPHIHTHLEMVFLRQGRSVAILDRQRYEIEAGDLFLAFPNQIHYYEDQEPLKLTIAIFSPEIHRQLEKLLTGRIPVCPVLKKDTLPKNTEALLYGIWKKKRSDSPFDRLQATGQLLSFLGEILPLFEYHEVEGDPDSVARILSYCSEHYTEALTLEVLSKELFLSKFYISRVFRERMKFGFSEFIGSLRVNYVCDRLDAGVPITEAALSAGFSSIRTFNRVFLKMMGMTPREYAKSIVRKERKP